MIPFDQGVVLANINAGVLYTFAISSLGVYGIMIAGWASNSKYAMFGALRAAAQSISYEIAMGFALIGVMMAAGSLNFQTIVACAKWRFLALVLVAIVASYLLCIGFLAWQKPIACHLMWRKVNRKLLQVFMWNIRA